MAQTEPDQARSGSGFVYEVVGCYGIIAKWKIFLQLAPMKYCAQENRNASLLVALAVLG